MKLKKIASYILVAVLSVTSLTSCGFDQFGQVAKYEKYELTPNEGFGDQVVTDENGNKEIVSLEQLTESDIQKMNGGKARFVYSDEGYVTFLNGKFSEKKINDYEDAVASIQGVAGLIGLGAGSEFFAVHYTKDAKGYTYYTFQQRYGDLTVDFATLRIIVDPDGYTAGLSSSFVPNLGIPEKIEEVGEEFAENTVRDWLRDEKGIEANILSEYTKKIAITVAGTTHSVYAVYIDNPYYDTNDFNKTFEIAYWEYFVTLDGKMITDYSIPVASIGEDNLDTFRNEDYFEGMEQTYKTYTVTRWDGTTEDITVPLASKPGEDGYYLMDIERKIAVGFFSELIEKGNTSFAYLRNIDTKVPDYVIFAYDNVIKAYDYYAGLGLYSVDGNGVPIMVCIEMEMDNACYWGINKGWGAIAFSPVNTYSQSLDVIGHEFTHGIMRESMTMVYPMGETGALGEAYSDVMGNIMEMSLGYTSDTDWLVGEQCGEAIRCMSDPKRYSQPITVYDKEFVDPADQDNDRGGVHQNCSLISSSAYKLFEAGMSYNDLALVYVKSIELLHPRSGFKEVYESLLMSIDVNGFDQKYKDVLTEYFTTAGMLD